MARTGAPTWARLIVKACKLSHLPRWRASATLMLGGDAADILAAWDVFCDLFELFLGADNYPLQIDTQVPYGPEDLPPP